MPIFSQAEELSQQRPLFLRGVVSAQTAVNLRSAPNVNSKILGQVPPGLNLDLSQVDAHWYRVESLVNQGGFIAGQFIQIIPTPGTSVPKAEEKVSDAKNSEIKVADAKSSATKVSESETSLANPVDKNKGAENKKSELIQEPPAWDAKQNQQFEEQIAKAFKKKATAPQEMNEVLMPLFFESRSMQMGQIQTQISVQSQGSAQEVLYLDSATLFKYLKLVVIDSWFLKPEIASLDSGTTQEPTEIAKRKWVSLEKFANSGLKLTYDQSLLEVYVSVPPELRAASIASVLKGFQALDETANADPVAKFSSYLNINASEVYDTRYSDYSDHRAPLRAELENGTNIFGTVIEANGRYLEDRTGGASDTTGLSRGDVRIVRDFPDSAMRTMAGDLTYQTQGFQIFRPMAGFTMSSQLSMAKSKLTYPTGNYELFLQRNSKVYIWINDQLQQVLDLPSGRHSLRDFPFTNGVNDLRLEIIDDVGREEVINYTYFSSTELLRPQLHQFSYSLGAPANDLAKVRTYESSNSTLSAFHRYGLAENMTVGANIQTDKYQSVLGLETLLSTEYGYFKLEPGYSKDKDGVSGGAFQARYSYSDYKGEKKTQRAFSLGLFVGGTTFATLGSSATSASKRTFEMISGYTQGFSRSLSGSFNFSYRNFNTSTGPKDAFTVGVGANKRWENGLTASASLSHSKIQTGEEQLNALVFLLWSFPKEKQLVTAIHNTADESNRLDWSYNPGSGANSSTYGASLRDGKNERGYNAQLQHDGNRFRTSLAHEVLFGKNEVTSDQISGPGKKPTNHVTTLTMGTSLAYAGGHFAIGRPVADSFAIIAPVKNLAGQKLEVNPIGENSYAAKSDWMGPALLPELGSYTLTDVKVSGKNLPGDLSIPRDHFSVYPGYKSGYSFEIGTDATIYLSAKILGPDGNPLPLASGMAISLDNPEQMPITIFTNKKGSLNSEGFRPGRYRLEISPETFQPTEIVIPEEATVSFELGNIQLKEK